MREERLATMSEPERERFIAREFRVKALTYAVMWGFFAGGAFHLRTDPTTSANILGGSCGELSKCARWSPSVVQYVRCSEKAESASSSG